MIRSILYISGILIKYYILYTHTYRLIKKKKNITEYKLFLIH